MMISGSYHWTVILVSSIESIDNLGVRVCWTPML
jgi:hypothetical protein